MDVEQFRKAGYQAIDRICDYYYSLQEKSVVSKVEPGYLRGQIPLTPPEEGEDFQVIADDYQKLIAPGLTHWQHPSFFAYFPTSCTFEGILGDLYASSMACNPGFNWSCSPACTELEAIVMDWAADLLGLSDAFKNSSGVGGGVIQTTASDSALVTVVAARSLYLSRHPDTKMEDLVIYVTTQTHSLGAKAALVLGLRLRSIDVTQEDSYSLRVATVGTTSTGAVDNLPEIREVVKDYPSLWVHIDSAWAGSALACPENRDKLYLNEINAFAYSFCSNFHKWGLVNFDCSTLWVRDRKHLTDALDITPPFLRTKHGDAGTVIDYRNWHLGLGRRFRSLKLWFVLRGYGVSGFQSYIRQCIAMNGVFAKLVEKSDILEFVTKPSLALSVFRVVPKLESEKQQALSQESLNELNRLFYGRISARDDIMLTQTSLNGIFCVRLAVGASRTTEKHMHDAYSVIEKEAKAAIEVWDQTVNGVALIG
ncbi:hypothetical protein D9613_000357 [Agrocybe pediades]|uniref:Aromatic-L-amino-acid decarboxylase n=1 Tax=Agrocybe pediades TaxID=84607 RepID=A0A8H4R010_9AGAR|nr:hypothetical protein D9613_000357 [Agrocybe pediades]